LAYNDKKRKKQFLRSQHALIFSTQCATYLWLYSPLLDPGRFFSFLIFYRVGRTPWTGDQSVDRPLPAHRTALTQIKRIQTSMPQGGFEPTIPVFEWAKTVHALHRAATVISNAMCYTSIILHAAVCLCITSLSLLHNI
jgi:hypothetical protein